MKVFTKALLGLSLSTRVFSASLEVRQGSGTITVTYAAVNRLLNRGLTEVFNISNGTQHHSVDLRSNIPSPTDAVLTSLGTINAPGMANAVVGDISSLSNTLTSASSIFTGATGLVTCTATTTPPINAGDVTMLLSTLTIAQSIVSSVQTTLTGAVSSLSSGNIAAISSSVRGLEASLNTFNLSLQSYTASLLPCGSQVTPSGLQPLESALTSVGNSFQSLLDAFGVGGILNGLVTTAVP